MKEEQLLLLIYTQSMIKCASTDLLSSEVQVIYNMKALKCKTLGASVMYVYTHIQGIRGQMLECTGSIRTIGKDESSE